MVQVNFVISVVAQWWAKWLNWSGIPPGGELVAENGPSCFRGSDSELEDMWSSCYGLTVQDGKGKCMLGPRPGRVRTPVLNETCDLGGTGTVLQDKGQGSGPTELSSR